MKRDLLVALHVKGKLLFSDEIDSSEISGLFGSSQEGLERNILGLTNPNTSTIWEGNIRYGSQLFSSKEGDSADHLTSILDQMSCDYFNEFNGNWKLCHWNPKRQEVILAKGKFGHQRLYYIATDQFLVCASDLKQILSLPFVKKELNRKALVQLGPNGDRDSETFFKGVHQIPNGHFLKYSTKGYTLNSYWQPNFDTPIVYREHAQYVEHFSSILDEVIGDSLHDFNKPGVACSSGLDSATIFSVAQEIKEKQNRSLDALTWKPNIISPFYKSRKRTHDESELVKKHLVHSKYSSLHVVTSQNGNLVPLYKDIIESCSQPIINLQPHMMEVIRKSSEIGNDVLLNGFFGNFTISYTGWRQKMNTSSDLSKFVLRDYKTILRILQKRLFHEKNINQNNDYINDAAISDHRELLFDSAPYENYNAKDLEHGRSRYEHYPIIFKQYRSSSLQDISCYAESLGVKFATPLMDSRIIDFCLNTPNWVFSSNGIKKRILKESMKRRIAPEILHAKKRGLQGSNYPIKFELEQLEFARLIASFRASKLVSYWVNIDLLELHLNQFIKIGRLGKLGKKDFEPNFNIVNRGVQVALFLQNMDRGEY